MAVSPWAQLEQQANTAQNLQPPPGVFATPEMTGPPPDMPQQQTPQIARIPTAGEQQIAADQGQLQKVRWNQAHPWGTPENHPGKLGKVAHVFSEIGNIAGDVFAPGVMANIPQTQMGMKANEIGLTNRLNKEIGDESLNQERAATQAETEEKTREAPGKAKSEEDLQGAQTGNLESETAERGTDLAHAYAHRVNQILKESGDPSTDPTVMYLQDAIQALQKPSAGKGQEHISVLGPDGKTPIVANYDPATGITKDASGKVIPNPVPYTPPNYASVLPMMLPTHTTTVIDPKTGVPTEYQYNPKTRQFDQPVGQSASGGYGHEAAQAGAVERAGNELIQTLQANRKDLGTLGAWVSQYGLNTPIADPKLASIQAQMKSFADLNPAMHGARGGAAMKHFEDLVGGLQKNPDASIAGIRGILTTAHNINPGVAEPEGAGGPPPGAKVIKWSDVK